MSTTLGVSDVRGDGRVKRHLLIGAAYLMLSPTIKTFGYPATGCNVALPQIEAAAAVLIRAAEIVSRVAVISTELTRSTVSVWPRGVRMKFKFF